MGDNKSSRLHVSKFPHSSDESRADKWREWDALLHTAFGEIHPLLANQFNHKCDPEETFFGMPWHPMLHVDSLTEEQEVKLQTEFMKAQYGLLHVLRDNFGSHEKQIVNMHAPDVLAKKLAEKHEWEEDHPNLTWLPFGYLCKHAIAEKYDDSGVTDALSKLSAFNEAKSFAFSDVQKWASKLDHAWHEYESTVIDPSHMAAVETLHQIIHSGHDDWKAWALQFSLKQGNKPYTIDALMDKVIAQEKLMKSADKGKPKAQAMLALKRNNQQFKKGICNKQGCSRKVRNPRLHKFCDEHFRLRKNDNADKVLSEVPKHVRFATHNKKLAHFKKKIAEFKNRRDKSDKEAFLAEATALLADAMDDDASADDEDESVTVAPKKKKKKKKKPAAEANVAEALVAEPPTPLKVKSSTSKSTVKAAKALVPSKQKSKSSIAKKVHGRAGITVKLGSSGRKVKKGVAAPLASKKGKAHSAHFATSMLDGCVIQKFAGCDMPSFFKKK